MIVKSKKLLGTFEIIPEIFKDYRGFFTETFQSQRYLEKVGIKDDFVQSNQIYSKKNTLRGIHLQNKFPQGKLIRIIAGIIYDVAVDLRKDSKTYGKWDSIILDSKIKNQFWIPKGFGHGFLTLSENSIVEYMCTDYYNPNDELCIVWNDKKLNIEWPSNKVILSEKDKKGDTFKDISEVISF